MPSRRLNFGDYVSLMRDRLLATLPGLDTTPGSITRNIVDAVAEVSAQADLAAPGGAEAWDFDAASGEALDRLAAFFGFERRPATVATGFVTVVLGGPLTRDYLVEKGTAFYFSELGVERRYLCASNMPLVRYRTQGIIPVVAEGAGATGNCRSGLINRCSMPIENLLRITNEEPVTGGAAPESDESLRGRMRRDLFRSRLGSEAYYRDIAMRHPNVSSAQLITPAQYAEETLTVLNGVARSQEDSLAYSYEDGLSVYLVRENRYLTEGIDYSVERGELDSGQPLAPSVRFNSAALEGEYVRLRHRYCSTASRNDPLAGMFHYLDLYVRGRRPEPWVDRAIFPRASQVGRGPVAPGSHPETTGLVGAPCYVFVRQPVARLVPTIEFSGVVYREGRDYLLAKDASRNASSSRARDALVWITALPPGRPFPAFNVDYYHEAVTGEVQEALDAPEAHAAGEDILVHSASEITLDFDFEVEWSRGREDPEALRTRLADYLSGVEMGSTVQLGVVVGVLYSLASVKSVTLGSAGVLTSSGRSYRHAVPLPDGTVPVAGLLNVKNLAPNSYSETEARRGD